MLIWYFYHISVGMHYYLVIISSAKIIIHSKALNEKIKLEKYSCHAFNNVRDILNSNHIKTSNNRKSKNTKW